jgi:hypothetical protein
MIHCHCLTTLVIGNLSTQLFLVLESEADELFKDLLAYLHHILAHLE